LHPNAAIVAHNRLTAAFDARDWETMRARFAPDARIEERRALLRSPAIDAEAAVSMDAGEFGLLLKPYSAEALDDVLMMDAEASA